MRGLKNKNIKVTFKCIRIQNVLTINQKTNQIHRRQIHTADKPINNTMKYNTSNTSQKSSLKYDRFK